ncbi:MAG: hypothetical protein CML13_14515 [Puniceicoccaceae bacterium]|nr:hypothetical protein [Puniceicoccaceae bacterium]
MTTSATDHSTIQSKVVVFPSRSGKKMVGFIDALSTAAPDAPFVVMAPKYGQSKKNNLQMSYVFAQNGLRVLRFDHTNHIGESEGEIVDYTLPGAVADILAALDYLETEYGHSKVILQANSMSARCAIRAASLDARIERLICLVGIVDFRETITLICQKDIIDVYVSGVEQGVGDILGHDVNIDQFLKTSVDENMHDSVGTRDDFLKAKCDVFMFAAEKDAWVDFEKLKQLAEGANRVQIREVKGVMHEMMENPQAALKTIFAAVFVAKHGRFPREEELEDVAEPNKREVFKQNKVERNRLRAVAPKRESEADFWHSYLDKYKMLESVSAYKDYLKLIADCLGSPTEGAVYLDCGCGNGMFGAWCLRDLIAQSAVNWKTPATYFGLDLTGKGLSEAARRHSTIANEGGGPALRNLNRMYYRFDLDRIDASQEKLLPLADQSADRICCSLLISYLKDPVFLVKELYRVLKPDGRIILSSMKPYCDLSLIYKGFLGETNSEEAVESARNLLSAAGVLQLKEDEGHYIFYSEDELVEIMRQGGFDKTHVFRSFGEQANLVSSIK